MISNNDISILNQSNNQVISNIKQLQATEMELFNSLEKGLANNTLSLSQEKSIVGKINEISQIRVNLYKNLNGQTSFYTDNITSSVGTMKQQEQAIYIVENELNEAKRRLALIEEDKNNKLRLVEINTYYGDRYADYAEMMKTIVIVCIPIIVLAYLAKLGFLPPSIYNILLIISVVFIAIYMGWKILYLNFHDEMNYQEYNWTVNTSKYPILDTTSTTSSSPWSSSPTTCIGQDCCLCGSTYDATLNRCVPNSMSSCPLYTSPALANTSSAPSPILETYRNL